MRSGKRQGIVWQRLFSSVSKDKIIFGYMKRPASYHLKLWVSINKTPVNAKTDLQTGQSIARSKQVISGKPEALQVFRSI